MDAYTYLAYDHVFTNAQSGNVVLLAVYLAGRDWTQAIKHVPALLAFLPGVLAGQAMAAGRTGGKPRPDVLILAVELSMLLVIWSVGRSLSAAAVTFGISLVSAMQNTVFKHGRRHRLHVRGDDWKSTLDVREPLRRLVPRRCGSLR